jgi:hypothetical protein
MVIQFYVYRHIQWLVLLIYLLVALILLDSQLFAQQKSQDTALGKVKDSTQLQEKSSTKATDPSPNQLSLSNMIPRSLLLETETAFHKTPHILRIGLFDITLKANHWLTLKMWSTPTLLGLYNLGFQVPLYQYRNIYINLDFHYATLNLNRFAPKNQGEKRIHLVPIFLNFGWHVSQRWYLGLSLRSYTVEGNINTAADAELPFGTVLASSNQQIKLQVGYAFSEAWSFWFFLNQVVNQSYQGSIYLEKELASGVNIEAYGKAKTEIEKNAGAWGLRIVRKGDFIDFQIGLDRGRPPLYVTGLLLPKNEAYTLPYIDFSIKF